MNATAEKKQKTYTFNLTNPPYKDKYFDSQENFFIAEKYVLGQFYRTPFVVLRNKIEHVFPIIGKNTTFKKCSDYHWTDFEYGKKERRIVPRLLPILKKMVELFDLKDGVYVAEFITTDDGLIYLLEFSPRQTSQRIAKIIKLATGIDLHELSIDIFMSLDSVVQSNNRDIRMRIERESNRLNKEFYKIIDIQKEKSVYGDAIETIYYERKDRNEQ